MGSRKAGPRLFAGGVATIGPEEGVVSAARRRRGESGQSARGWMSERKRVSSENLASKLVPLTAFQEGQPQKANTQMSGIYGLSVSCWGADMSGSMA